MFWISEHPLIKFYTEQMFVLMRMQLRNNVDTNSEAFQVLIGLCTIYTILNLECFKCAAMRFHCTNGLDVLRICAVAYLRGNTAGNTLALLIKVSPLVKCQIISVTAPHLSKVRKAFKTYSLVIHFKNGAQGANWTSILPRETFSNSNQIYIFDLYATRRVS